MNTPDASARARPRRADARPLVVRFGAFGDMVQLAPVIELLHRRSGMLVDVACSGEWSRPLLSGQPGVGDLLIIGSKRAPLWLSRGQQRLVRRMRNRGAGPVWLCEDHPKSRWLLDHAGIPSEYICAVSDYPRQPGDRYNSQLMRMGRSMPAAWSHAPWPQVSIPDRPRLVLDAECRTDLDRWLIEQRLSDRPLVLIQAGNKRTMRRGQRARSSNTKYWPEQRWAELIQAIHAIRPDCAVVMLGVRQERAMNADIMTRAHIACAYNAAGELPIPRLLALLERAESLISVDTGPAHAAVAVGCPLVLLFGSEEASRHWSATDGVPFEPIVSDHEGRLSLRQIQSETVVSAWKRLNDRISRRVPWHNRGGLSTFLQVDDAVHHRDHRL